MKVKAGWAAFIPITLGVLFLHLYYTFFIGGGEITQRLFGDYHLLLNETTEPEMIVILGAVLFILVLFFSLIDRKTAPTAEIKGNFPAGLFAILTALLLGMQYAVGVIDAFTAESFSVAALIMNIFGIVAALVFAIFGMGLLIGFNIAKKIRFLMILPTVWAAVSMITAFSSHRIEAPSFSFFDVIVWVFFSLFLLNNTMVLCGIDLKNPVKSSFVFGLPAILFTVAYIISSVHEVMNETGYFDFTQLISQFSLGTLALYALFSLIQLSSVMETKKKTSAKSSSKNTHEITEENIPEAAFGVGSTKYVTAEFEKLRLEKAVQKAKERTGSIPIAGSDDSRSDGTEEPVSTLDKIDQLIMELSEDDNKK